MKPMKFFKSENHHFTNTSPQSWNILILAIFFAYYNRWHQSINWSAIEILIKIYREKAVKLTCLDICLNK